MSDESTSQVTGELEWPGRKRGQPRAPTQHVAVVVSSSMQEAPAGWRLTSGDPETILEELRRDFSSDLEIGGPTLAAGFIRRGLVDEYELVVHPVILGGGTPIFPDLERPAGLRLLETRTYSSGAVYLGFAAR
jgi:dihydrofolate reductase